MTTENLAGPAAVSWAEDGVEDVARVGGFLDADKGEVAGVMVEMIAILRIIVMIIPLNTLFTQYPLENMWE